MGGYYEPSQIFTLYGIVALAYFVVNFAATGMTDGTDTYTTAEYCSRIAGLLAARR